MSNPTADQLLPGKLRMIARECDTFMGLGMPIWAEICRTAAAELERLYAHECPDIASQQEASLAASKEFGW